MKKIPGSLFFLIGLSIISGFTPVQENHEDEKQRIEVSFNGKMEFNDLVKLKLDLAEAGITLHYRLLEFDKWGGLTSLEFKVDCNDGFRGSGKNTAINNNTRWGFYRDYRPNVKSPFGAGVLE